MAEAAPFGVFLRRDFTLCSKRTRSILFCTCRHLRNFSRIDPPFFGGLVAGNTVGGLFRQIYCVRCNAALPDRVVDNLHDRTGQICRIMLRHHTQQAALQFDQSAGRINANAANKMIGQIGVEMLLAPFSKFSNRLDRLHGRMITAVAGNGVVDVDNGRHLAILGNLVAFQTCWIAGAIVPLVVLRDDLEKWLPAPPSRKVSPCREPRAILFRRTRLLSNGRVC